MDRDPKAVRVAALYDIHGNLPALEAVLQEVHEAGVDLVVVGGDVVPGPMPVGAIELLQGLDLPVRYLRGNGEREVLAERSGTGTTLPDSVRAVLRWVGGCLSAAQAEWLEEWPATVEVEVRGVGPVLFCHATPESDCDIFTRLTPQERLLPVFGPVDAPLVVCGHTHMPFDRHVGGVRVLNAGSVGMPFGDPGADWLLLGPEVEHRRTSYDLAGAAERIRATDYPEAEEFAAGNVLGPPTEAAMMELLERGALK